VTFSDIPNWPEMKQRYLDFWAHRRPTDRPLMHVQVMPAQEPAPPDPPGDAWLEPEVAIRRQEQFDTTWTFFAELFPKRQPPIGPNTLGAYVGAKPWHDGYTMWLEPTLDDWAQVESVRFDPGNRYWQATLRQIDYVIEHYGGRVMLGQVDLGGPLDVVGALRGTQRMCYDVVDQPDRVRDLCDRLAEIWKQFYDIQVDLLRPYADGGSCCWLPMWGPGRVGIVQDDLGLLVGADDYQRLVLPSIRTMLAHVDHGVYHFHAAARHLLDLLLDLPELHAIQYGVDPNSPPILECMDDLARIQQAGKGLFVGILKPEEVAPIRETLDPTSLVLLVQCDNIDQAQAVVAAV
jgi:hypothetical protein